MFKQLLFSDFAYSREMQLILTAFAAIANLYFGYIMTNVVLALFNESASVKQKLTFSFYIYILLHLAIIYGAYALNGFHSLNPIVYLLVTVPNPLIPFIYYLCCIKVLKLSKYCSIHLFVLTYLYLLVVKAITRAVGIACFPQRSQEYNYLLDAMSLLSCVFLNIVLYFIAMALIKHFIPGVKVFGRLFVKSVPKVLMRGFIMNCLAYGLMISISIIFNENPMSYLYTASFLLTCLIVSYYRVLSKASIYELQNKNEHMDTLMASIDDFNGIKHDFYNVLQTYGGYIQVGDLSELKKYHEDFLNTTLTMFEHLELNKKIEENPALISLLMEKQKYAEKLNVTIRFTILCEIKTLHIDDISLCRSLACLLDNAIEAADESTEKTVVFSIGKKKNENILITIMNSTMNDVNVNRIVIKGVSSKLNHRGLGIPQTMTNLSKFGNCILHFEYYCKKFTVYIEICPNSILTKT